MEAAAAAASAAAAAAKDAAAAAGTAAEATDAAKAAAVAASAAALNAKEAAAAASAAALNAQEAAMAASAAALDAKEAAAVGATAGQAAAAAAAAMQASQKRRFVAPALDAKEAATAGQAAGPINAVVAAAAAVVMQASKKPKLAAVAATAGAATLAALQASNEPNFNIIDVDQDPQGSGHVDDDVGSVDLMGRLPDAVLCTIVSLLPTKEAARTQVISRRWRPLWRSAPLNLTVDQDLNIGDYAMAGLISKRNNMISKILSVHPGPARRFSLCLSLCELYGKVKAWLSCQALDKLQEFELIPGRWFTVRDKFCMLPSSVYRFAPTLRVAKFGGCSFPDLIVKLSLKFPCLKQLTLDRVTISEGSLQSMLSGCYVLESLELKKNSGFRRLFISSQTLKSIGFCTNWCTEGVSLLELVIEDAPCLERLLALDPGVGPRTIRVISAPKLNILGVLSDSIAELQLGTTVFQLAAAFIHCSFGIPTCRLLFL